MSRALLSDTVSTRHARKYEKSRNGLSLYALDTRHFSRGNNFERAAVPPGPNTSYPLELETYSRFLRSRRTRNATPTFTKSILQYLIRLGREIFDASCTESRKRTF